MTESITNTAAFKLHQATLLIDRIADDFLVRMHGIHYAPFLVLLMVRVLDSPSQQAIAASLGVSRASITQRVSALIDKGLVDTRPDPSDSRANIVSLTPAGVELVDTAWAALDAHQSGLDDGVDEAALVAQLDRLIGNGLRILRAEA